MSHAELYALRRKMGMLFQFGALFTDMTVFDNVAFPMREHTDLSEEMIRDLVLMKLEAVGLRGAHALMPGELSGGMARRVALAGRWRSIPCWSCTTSHLPALIRLRWA
jgi:phospholipid/cholesterol/gamma-HCH transport system ATP-binding protein